MSLDGAELTWLGHASFVLKSPGGRYIVFDPWLEGNPKCPPEFYNWDKADYILLTHGHFDHMGSAEMLAKKTGATVISNFEIATYLASLGVSNTIGMNKGGTLEFGDIKITMVYADHSSGISTDTGIIYGGEAAGFVVTLENGLSIYHAGDTNVFGDMTLIKTLYAPDVALLPIGGHYTMSPKEAAYAVDLLEPKVVIPMHYGTFDALKGSPDALKDLLADKPVTLEVLQPGQQYR
ncbi:metal-dependent hydrolase [Sulfobacillus thermosulfidooxidans]|uniref:metal-dependent hydrolase n=1 Tax=Sulfobacillus thermosulfidooxidans TaxID=28034 RepID=UPI0006B5171D|nr:metal-dependent hydrolase [Sulfobacillus thermosulfidooxidans]